MERTIVKHAEDILDLIGNGRDIPKNCRQLHHLLCQMFTYVDEFLCLNPDASPDSMAFFTEVGEQSEDGQADVLIPVLKIAWSAPRVVVNEVNCIISRSHTVRREGNGNFHEQVENVAQQLRQDMEDWISALTTQLTQSPHQLSSTNQQSIKIFGLRDLTDRYTITPDQARDWVVDITKPWIFRDPEDSSRRIYFVDVNHREMKSRER